MNKEEFKKIFKELCESQEIDFFIHPSNDGNYYFSLNIDGERVVDEIIKVGR